MAGLIPLSLPAVAGPQLPASCAVPEKRVAQAPAVPLVRAPISAAEEPPREWLERMVRPCARTGNRMSC